MNSSSRSPTAHFDIMMERLGIDAGCCVEPRFGLLVNCALRNCGACTAAAACADWMEKDHVALELPRFCPNVDLLAELLCDTAVGRCPHLIH
jgi:Family of unknown function (DUF6455)